MEISALPKWKQETGGEKAIKPGRIVIVNYKLFLLNQHKERRTYLLEDEKHCIYRTIVGGLAGFDRFITLEDFSNASNGYVIDDTCEFGAEVFVFERRKGSGEHVYMNLNTVTYKHVWKVTKFSKKNASFYLSKPFTDHKYCTWRLELHPKGCRFAKVSKYLSLFLQLEKPCLPTGSKVLVEVGLRILNQNHGEHHSRKAEEWLRGPYWNCGWPQFITEEANARFLKNDNCIIEVEITIAGITVPGICRP